MPSRAVRAVCLTLLCTTACGVPGADGDRARVLADTCASTIARAGLPAPAPGQLTPEAFEDERRRLLDTGRRFNTVTPYRNVCTDVRDALRSEASADAERSGDADGPVADDPDRPDAPEEAGTP